MRVRSIQCLSRALRAVLTFYEVLDGAVQEVETRTSRTTQSCSICSCTVSNSEVSMELYTPEPDIFAKLNGTESESEGVEVAGGGLSCWRGSVVGWGVVMRLTTVVQSSSMTQRNVPGCTDHELIC